MAMNNFERAKVKRIEQRANRPAGVAVPPHERSGVALVKAATSQGSFSIVDVVLLTSSGEGSGVTQTGVRGPAGAKPGDRLHYVVTNGKVVLSSGSGGAAASTDVPPAETGVFYLATGWLS